MRNTPFTLVVTLSLTFTVFGCDADDQVEIDRAGPYGDCSAECGPGGSWSWGLAGGTGCVCTPACDTLADCPEVEGAQLSCNPQEDPDPGVCAIECESDADCPKDMQCQETAGCMWLQE